MGLAEIPEQIHVDDVPVLAARTGDNHVSRVQICARAEPVVAVGEVRERHWCRGRLHRDILHGAPVGLPRASRQGRQHGYGHALPQPLNAVDDRRHFIDGSYKAIWVGVVRRGDVFFHNAGVCLVVALGLYIRGVMVVIFTKSASPSLR